MAITKTEAVESIRIMYASGADPVVEVSTTITWDDPNDDALPISKGDYKTITKTTTSISYNQESGEATTTESTTDYSGEDAKVVAVCDLVWADPAAE